MESCQGGLEHCPHATSPHEFLVWGRGVNGLLHRLRTIAPLSHYEIRMASACHRQNKQERKDHLAVVLCEPIYQFVKVFFASTRGLVNRAKITNCGAPSRTAPLFVLVSLESLLIFN